jgi:hypothetical protein
MRVDLGQSSRKLIAAIGFALLGIGFMAGVAVSKWVYGP